MDDGSGMHGFRAVHQPPSIAMRHSTNRFSLAVKPGAFLAEASLPLTSFLRLIQADASISSRAETLMGESAPMKPEICLSDKERRSVEEFRKKHRTGLLTLLFTDVVGSTDLKQRLGDAAGTELIHRQQSLLRNVLSAIPEAQEVSTAGDSFFIVFVKPSDAIRFALRLHSSLRAENEAGDICIRVRIGIHMGEVFIEEEHEGALERDILGLQVDLAWEIMSIASGGQILLTRSVFDNARAILKGESLAGLETLSWLNHGLYYVKGVEEPLEICEVGEDGHAPLKPPTESNKVKRYVAPDQEPVLGWRPAVEQIVPGTEWVLKEKLGEGGFGEVWKACNRITKDVRVFKFCFRADRLRSLKREMTLFRILKEVLGERPDIVRLYDVQFEEAPYYLMLGYTSGGDLTNWIQARGGFDSVPITLRLEIVAQIADAIAAAHSVGIIHKDIKPSNILIEERKGGHIQVRLTDFGIGHLINRDKLRELGITGTGFTDTTGRAELPSRTGTRLYTAPELIAGRLPSKESDVYSLGVLLYQMIIGHLCRPMTTDWENRVTDTLIRRDLRRCLAGEPSERFSSAADIALSLRLYARRHKQRFLARLCLLGFAAVLLFVYVPYFALWSADQLRWIRLEKHPRLHNIKNTLGLFALRRQTTIKRVQCVPEPPTKGKFFFWKSAPSAVEVCVEIPTEYADIVDYECLEVKSYTRWVFGNDMLREGFMEANWRVTTQTVNLRDKGRILFDSGTPVRFALVNLAAGSSAATVSLE